MKRSDWYWIIGLGVAATTAYLWYKARAAINLNWTLQNVSVELQGLSAQINTTMAVTNASTASVTLTNVNCSLYYNGSVIATAGLSQSIPPGLSSINIPFVVSDVTIVSDIIDILDGTIDNNDFQITGTGLIDNVPGTFKANYSLPI